MKITVKISTCVQAQKKKAKNVGLGKFWSDTEIGSVFEGSQSLVFGGSLRLEVSNFFAHGSRGLVIVVFHLRSFFKSRVFQSSWVNTAYQIEVESLMGFH